MKPRALLLVLLAFAASTLSAADKLDALRKAGAKISTSPDGSVSIHFSVPKPPSGPFGEPIFDPNFRPSPPLEAAQLETLANIPKLRSLKLSGIALRPKAFETLEILTAPATSVPSTYETYGASTTRASPTSPPSRPSTSRIAEPSPRTRTPRQAQEPAHSQPTFHPSHRRRSRRPLSSP